MEKKPLNEKTLQEIIRRIVAVAQPEKIILFGFAARGEIGPNSDADLASRLWDIMGGELREIWRSLKEMGNRGHPSNTDKGIEA